MYLHTPASGPSPGGHSGKTGKRVTPPFPIWSPSPVPVTLVSCLDNYFVIRGWSSSTTMVRSLEEKTGTPRPTASSLYFAMICSETERILSAALRISADR